MLRISWSWNVMSKSLKDNESFGVPLPWRPLPTPKAMEKKLSPISWQVPNILTPFSFLIWKRNENHVFLKNNFLKIKNIINIYFNTKNYLKKNYFHTIEQHVLKKAWCLIHLSCLEAQSINQLNKNLTSPRERETVSNTPILWPFFFRCFSWWIMQPNGKERKKRWTGESNFLVLLDHPCMISTYH